MPMSIGMMLGMGWFDDDMATATGVTYMTFDIQRCAEGMENGEQKSLVQRMGSLGAKLYILKLGPRSLHEASFILNPKRLKSCNVFQCCGRTVKMLCVIGGSSPCPL